MPYYFQEPIFDLRSLSGFGIADVTRGFLVPKFASGDVVHSNHQSKPSAELLAQSSRYADRDVGRFERPLRCTAMGSMTGACHARRFETSGHKNGNGQQVVSLVCRPSNLASSGLPWCRHGPPMMCSNG